MKTNGAGVANEGNIWLLWIMFASYFAFGSILNVVGVVIPIVIRQYQLSLFTGGLLAFAFFIAFGVFSVPAGLAADRLGSKPVTVSGMLLMSIGCGAISFATGFKAITVFAFIIGSGVALLQTAGNPLIGQLGRRENYHRNLTLTIGFCGIGAFVGPFCLSAIQSHDLPWQRLYGGYAVLCALLAFLLIFASFPLVQKKTEEKFRVKEIIGLLGHPVAVTYFLAVFFYVGGEVGTASWIVKFFQLVHGIGTEGRGIVSQNFLLRGLPALPVLTVSLFWGLQGVGRLTCGPGIRKLGARSMLRLYSLGTISALLFAIFGPPALSAVGFAVCGFFTSVLITLLFSGAIQSFRQRQGAISGLLITASIGGAIIPPLVGLVADHFGLRAAMIVPVLCFSYVLLVSVLGRASYE
jgi:FHS family L-fucose permease-like MFS transporter